jgi:hypothetical protein
MQCQACRRDLAEGEPIYRISNGYDGPWHQSLGGAVGSVCGDCKNQYWSWGQQWESAEPCAHCARRVIRSGRRKRPKYVVCGAACRAAVYGEVARGRRRLPSRRCADCGNDFVPKRSDAEYCSAACKQRAYRKRAIGPRLDLNQMLAPSPPLGGSSRKTSTRRGGQGRGPVLPTPAASRL